MDFSIVIPLRNEAGSIGPLVCEICSRTRDCPPHRIILVDDGSNDGTVSVIRRLRQKYGATVELVRNAAPSGQSTALHNGVQAAATRWVVTLDGDGQNDPADIPVFLERLEQDPDPARLLIGNRARRQDTWLRRVSSRIANGVRRHLLNDGSPDTGCGLKAFNRDFFLQLPYFDHMHRFMPALTRQYGGKVESIPVHHRPRRAGESKYGVFDRLWVGIVDLCGVAWLARRNRHTAWSRDNV